MLAIYTLSLALSMGTSARTLLHTSALRAHFGQGAQAVAVPPPRYVSIWKNEPFLEGLQRHTFTMPEEALAPANVTDVVGVLRSSVVEPHPKKTDIVLLRAFFTIYDLPLAPQRHNKPSQFFWENWGQVRASSAVRGQTNAATMADMYFVCCMLQSMSTA